MTKAVVDEFVFIPKFGTLPRGQKGLFTATVIMCTGKDAFHVRNNSIEISDEEDARAFKMGIHNIMDENGEELDKRWETLVGSISVWKTKWDFYETHCGGIRDHLMRNMGWGLELYYQMIKWAHENEMQIRSSKIKTKKNYINPTALRVWESSRLRNEFHIRKKNGRYVVDNV